MPGGYGLASGGSHSPAAALGAGDIEFFRRRQHGQQQQQQQDSGLHAALSMNNPKIIVPPAGVASGSNSNSNPRSPQPSTQSQDGESHVIIPARLLLQLSNLGRLLLLPRPPALASRLSQSWASVLSRRSPTSTQGSSRRVYSLRPIACTPAPIATAPAL